VLNAKTLSRVRGFVAAIVMSFALLVGSAGAASAATSDCPQGWSCVWRDSGWVTGGKGAALYKFYQCEAYFYKVTYAGTGIGVEQSVSSVSNKGNYDSARYYTDDAYLGYSFLLERGQGDSNLFDALGWAPKGYDDSLNSAKFVTATSTCR
jgi:hypothetical protein